MAAKTKTSKTAEKKSQERESMDGAALAGTATEESAAQPGNDSPRPAKRAQPAKRAVKRAGAQKTSFGRKSGKPKTSKPAHGSKSAFVRTLPSDMSAKEVVAKAKALGLKLSEAYVYKIRSDSKTARERIGRSHVPTTASATGTTATDFVRSLPPGTSAKEAVALAKERGIPLTTGYFYTLRSTLKLSGRRAGEAPATRGASRGRAANGKLGLRLTSSNPHEQAVLDAVASLGVERVQAVIATARKLA